MRNSSCVFPSTRFIFEIESTYMKRVKAACICQTLHFIPKEGIPRVLVPAKMREEIEYYKRKLDRSRTEYKIVEQTEQPDGSVIVKILKQHNATPMGEYLK